MVQPDTWEKKGAAPDALASAQDGPTPSEGRCHGTTPQTDGRRNRLRQRRGAELVAEAAAWERDNPDAFRFIESRALIEAGAGRRVSVQALICEARAIDFPDAAGGRTRINNNLAAPLGRLLRDRHPEIAPHLPLRVSMADEAEG